jgi:hypothetical protein
MEYKVDFKYVQNGQLMSGSFAIPYVQSLQEAQSVAQPHIDAFLARVSGSLYQG